MAQTHDPQAAAAKAEDYDVSQRADVAKLRKGAVGLGGVLFLTVTGSAPISAMLFKKYRPAKYEQAASSTKASSPDPTTDPPPARRGDSHDQVGVGRGQLPSAGPHPHHFGGRSPT